MTYTDVEIDLDNIRLERGTKAQVLKVIIKRLNGQEFTAADLYLILQDHKYYRHLSRQQAVDSIRYSLHSFVKSGYVVQLQQGSLQESKSGVFQQHGFQSTTSSTDSSIPSK